MKKLLLAAALLAVSTASLAVDPRMVAEANEGSVFYQLIVGVQYKTEGNLAKSIQYMEKALSNPKKLKKEYKKYEEKEMTNELLAMLYIRLGDSYMQTGNNKKGGAMMKKGCKLAPYVDEVCSTIK
ncbi:hypothetical protein A4G18_08990 [Pasteurellaceae bacterium Pebbles2]|nr:hypothetical protein [Pasteurellaceae bacterium Pebbles2]